MPRQVREANLSTREARTRLAVAKKPYYRGLDQGLHLGYRESRSGSAWVIRWYRDAGAYHTENLAGRPHDVLTADGSTVLSWNQAQAAARTLFERKQRAANRVLSILKAALNHAYQERRAASDEAWRRVKPFREVDAARIRYLNDGESRRLVNGCAPSFRPLVQAALLTGCRYGELTRLEAEDFNPDAGTLHVRISKSGKPRHVVLTDEGRRFFAIAVADKADNALIFAKSDGSPWGQAHQQRPFALACSAAELPALTFHELRHTYASRLVMKGAPLAVVAAQLGHSDTRMVEKHYGHMAPSYIADTVRAAFGPLDIVPAANMVPLAAAERAA